MVAIRSWSLALFWLYLVIFSISFSSVNLSLIIWMACGIFTMFGAYCYAELGCMIKKSGADYAYIHVTFGPLIAFVRLWIECIIVRPCTGAIQSLTFALYIVKPLFPDCAPPDSASRLLAACTYHAMASVVAIVVVDKVRK